MQENLKKSKSQYLNRKEILVDMMRTVYIYINCMNFHFLRGFVLIANRPKLQIVHSDVNSIKSPVITIDDNVNEQIRFVYFQMILCVLLHRIV